MREIEHLKHWQIAELILEERFDRKVLEYEANWLDKLANHLRDGDSFNEMDLWREHFAEPLKELKQRYKNI